MHEHDPLQNLVNNGQANSNIMKEGNHRAAAGDLVVNKQQKFKNAQVKNGLADRQKSFMHEGTHGSPDDR